MNMQRFGTMVLILALSLTVLAASPRALGVTCLGLPATIVGTALDEDIYGGPGNDVINGLGGNDRIYGDGGNDVICGDKGDDLLDGQGATTTSSSRPPAAGTQPTTVPALPG